MRIYIFAYSYIRKLFVIRYKDINIKFMEDVEKYRRDLEIIRLTAEQVIKDFGIFGFEIAFSGNEYTAYDELKKQLAPLLFNLYKENRSTFQSLLYRIDISEGQWKKFLQTASEDIPEKLAALVIEREFQKVLTRKFFS
jgi:hypothetical protein